MGSPADRPERLGVFDGFRAFALTGVVVFHIFGASGVLVAGRDDLVGRTTWILLGNTIDFFFVISGFLLFLPVLSRKGSFGSVRDFYIRRVARIQPEYWLSLAVVLAMIVLIPVAVRPPMPSIGLILVYVFDLQSIVRLFDADFVADFWIGGALWIIPVLIGLYLVLPLVSRFFYRHIWWGLGLAAAVTVAWKLAVLHLPGVFQRISGNEFSDFQVQLVAIDQTPAFAFSFALGMAAAVLYLRGRASPESGWVRSGVPLGAGLAIVIYLLASTAYYDAAFQSTTGIDGGSRGRMLIWENLASSASRAVLMLAIALGPLWIRRIFDNPGANWTAGQSYGIYLIHLPITFYVGQLLPLGRSGGLANFLLWSAVVLPLGFAYAWASRTWVGEPVLNRVRRALSNAPPT